MNKLWVFGDSFSEPFSKIMDTTGFGYRSKYNKWKGYISKSYGDIISEKLNLLHFNKAGGGNDNYTIFDTIIDSLDSISENDIVIVGWTSTLRFRLIDRLNNFNTIRPSDLDTFSTLNHTYEYDNISITTINEMLINRDNELYQYELNRFIKIINKSINAKKIIHWSPFQSTHPILNIHRISSLDSLELIKDETMSEINDGHYSENGHNNLANYFSKLIN